MNTLERELLAIALYNSGPGGGRSSWDSASLTVRNYWRARAWEVWLEAREQSPEAED